MLSPWADILLILLCVLAFMWWYAEVEKWLDRVHARRVARRIERIIYAELNPEWVDPATLPADRPYDWHEDGE